MSEPTDKFKHDIPTLEHLRQYTCRNCKFWNPRIPQETWGRCYKQSNAMPVLTEFFREDFGCIFFEHKVAYGA